MIKLDHLMYAVPDLELGMQQIHELTGIKPVMGGSHPGVGTRNALLSFSADQYLEICLLYTSPSPRDLYRSRMPSSA